MLRPLFSCLALGCCLAWPQLTQAQNEKPQKITVTDPAKADEDFKVQGEYVGRRTVGDAVQPVGVQVVAYGEGNFQAVLYVGGLPGAGGDKTKKEAYKGKREEGAVRLSGTEGKLEIKDGKLVLINAEGREAGQADRTERQSPTLGRKAPEGVVVLFNGTSADAFENGKMNEAGLLQVGVKSKQAFQNFSMHMEFMLPYMPNSTGQARGNSGLYIQDRYECQILDSFGLEGKNNECGGFYTLRDPDINMCFPPLVWQTYDIDFTAAQFDDAGKKTKDAVVTVRHNGVVIHESYSLPKATPGGKNEAPAAGPLQLQNHGNPVVFNNIWVLEQK